MDKDYQTIEIDCAPGITRPDVHMQAIIEQSGLEIECPETTHRMFGEWGWDWKHLPLNEWQVLKETAKTYLTEAYNTGMVRYAGW